MSVWSLMMNPNDDFPLKSSAFPAGRASWWRRHHYRALDRSAGLPSSPATWLPQSLAPPSARARRLYWPAGRLARTPLGPPGRPRGARKRVKESAEAASLPRPRARGPTCARARVPPTLGTNWGRKLADRGQHQAAPKHGQVSGEERGWRQGGENYHLALSPVRLRAAARAGRT